MGSEMCIRDRATPNLVSSKHRQGIKRRRNKFRRLAQAKTPIKAKRRILTQKAAPSYHFWFHYWVQLLVVRIFLYADWCDAIISWMNFQLRSDQVMCVEGPSQSGKTEFVLRLLESKDELFRNPLNKVLWCYGCLLYTSPSPRDLSTSRMPSSA